jgi:SAM-dependent methyltransferase
MKEEEIRPQPIFDEYLRLAAQDTRTYFSGVQRTSAPCPACGNAGERAFRKHGFSYEVCPHCLTLFVSPRPAAGAFCRYYTESPSSRYWASTFYRNTAEARRLKLWKPKARMIRGILERHAAIDFSLVDIGAGFGLFAQEYKLLDGLSPIAIEPSPDLANACREKSLTVIQKFLEDVCETDLPQGPKAFVSFELFEHLHDPEQFLTHLYGLMSPGDLFIFTTLSGSGVDIQALWQDSKSVSPPHHLNFFNPRSIELLLSRLGFRDLAVTTPGKLDIDIMANNRAAIKDRFWRTFVDRATDAEKAAWQEVISANGWSSHMMVVCRKP